MIVCIAGSRCFPSEISLIESAVQASKFHITHVIAGGDPKYPSDPSIDRAAIRWAKVHGIPHDAYRANWPRYGRRAGMIRNMEMARVAHGLIAIWDGRSPGTANMILAARSRRLPIRIYDPKELGWIS